MYVKTNPEVTMDGTDVVGDAILRCADGTRDAEAVIDAVKRMRSRTTRTHSEQKIRARLLQLLDEGWIDLTEDYKLILVQPHTAGA